MINDTNHISLKHKKSMGTASSVIEPSDGIDTDTCTDMIHQQTFDTSLSDSHGADDHRHDSTSCHMTASVQSETLVSHCAKWVLKIGETYKLTRNALTRITQDVSDLFEIVLDFVKNQISNILLNHNVASNTVSDVMNVFSKENTNIRPFDLLSTFPLQLKYYCENFNLIVCHIII
jgi:hypothetical protein